MVIMGCLAAFGGLYDPHGNNFRIVNIPNVKEEGFGYMIVALEFSYQVGARGPILPTLL